MATEENTVIPFRKPPGKPKPLTDRILEEQEKLRTAMGVIGVAREATVDDPHQDVHRTLCAAYARFADVVANLDEIIVECVRRELNTTDRNRHEVTTHG